MSAVEFTVKLKRHKHGTWSVYITYPDGSWEHRRGLVDYGHAEAVVGRAIWKVEREQEAAA